MLVTGDGRDTDTLLRHHLLALACGVDVNIATGIAAHLSELFSDDGSLVF